MLADLNSTRAKLSDLLLKVRQGPDVIAKREAGGIEARLPGRKELADTTQKDHWILGDFIKAKRIKP